MSPLPDHRPDRSSLGPLEAEIMQLVWELHSVTVKDIHERLLSDPDRELTYSSVTTVLRRLTHKGWLACDATGRTFYWRPLISRADAQVWQAHDRLRLFLSVGTPEVVAAFADSLDHASLEQLEAIARRIEAVRKAREED
ncbi:MAG: BlaI/MecI/CopY family transcriptional regulator [Gemmatimonadaceae bacterium]|nr:BlaI/MecI/CopY family transcriptional regulator [Gloeobacterales cyanobacterium ES-bin-141]